MLGKGEEKVRRALALYARAAGSAALPEADREELSARAGAFADLCGSAAMAEAAERLHAARFKPTDKLPASSGPAVGQKRTAAELADEAAAKRHASDVAAAAAAGYTLGPPPAAASAAVAPATSAAAAAYYAAQPAAYSYGYYQSYPTYSYAQY